MQAGDKVEYKSGDKWKAGVIHGVKKAQGADGKEAVVGYLIDTGKDVRVDEYPSNKRDDAINERVQKLVDQGTDTMEALKKVEAQKDLPPSKVEVTKVRQPEQVEILPGDVRAAK